MSTPSPGPHIIPPDKPVARHSADFDRKFRDMHRQLNRLMGLPSILEMNELLQELDRLYYLLRDHLEADDGICQLTADAFEVPESGAFLQQLVAWEGDHTTAVREYDARSCAETRLRYGGEYTNYWRMVRLSVWKHGICLRTAADRIANGATN